MLVSQVLKKDGHEVLAAEDGAKGLALICEHKPDLVVSDVQMPKLNGFQVLEQVRADARISDDDTKTGTAYPRIQGVTALDETASNSSAALSQAGHALKGSASNIAASEMDDAAAWGWLKSPPSNMPKFQNAIFLVAAYPINIWVKGHSY